MNEPAIPVNRVALAYVAALIEVSDNARDLVGDVGTETLPGERIRQVRNLLRMPTLTALDRCVLVELAEGATWAEVADGLGLTEEATRHRYAKTAQLWSEGKPTDRMNATLLGEHSTGLPHDPNPECTAETYDAWYQRHTEPWGGDGPGPVSQLFAPDDDAL